MSASTSLLRVARVPGMRALAWNGDELYASRGYQLLRAKVCNLSDTDCSGNDCSSNDSFDGRTSQLIWQHVATFRPALRRRLSVMNRLAARLFRDGFHALARLPSGTLVAAVPGAIVTLGPKEAEFRLTHRIARGTRPLHIAVVPGGSAYWGEYFDNPSRDEVHIYGSGDAVESSAGRRWSVAYTFPKGAIRHVHNIVYDRWGDCLWILTGDYGPECRILRASRDFGRVDIVLQGHQQARAVAAVPTEDGLYFSSDTPLESNHIYRIDRQGQLAQLAPVDSSSIYGCRVADYIFFSTMVEPSKVNCDRHVRVYGNAGTRTPPDWQPLLAWRKDGWPMGPFQYGNAFMPDGDNTTPYLAVTTVAVNEDDMTTSLYRICS